MRYFILGYGLMFGGYSLPLIGLDSAPGDAFIGSGKWVFLWKGGFGLTDLNGPSGAALAGFFLYMVAFMDTTGTIPTGAMAERWQWKNFVLWGLFCGGIYYPIFGAWTWGGGWLSQLGNSAHLGVGYVDFAGSGVVHTMGGVAALAGATGDRSPHREVQGWQGACVAGPSHPDGHARNVHPAVRLVRLQRRVDLCGHRRAIRDSRGQHGYCRVRSAQSSRCLWVMWRTGKPDPGMMANGMLAGLVAITAPCAFVDPIGAAIIGSIAGVLVVLSISFVENKLKVDDPVGAISVHGVCGTFGVLAVGLFANGKYGAGWNATTEGKGAELSGVTGIFHNFSDGIGQLGAQAIGAVVLWTVMFAIVYGWFKLSNLITPIRSKEEDELVGLDLPEMGVLAYPEFSQTAGHN